MALELTGKVRAALDKYKMIKKGDTVAVGVSGGKDSLYLLYSLHEIRRYYPDTFTLKAISVDPCFDGQEENFEEIEKLCKELDIEYKIRRTDLGNIICEERIEHNPCSLCSRMRRGILDNMAKELACNKLALGHNFDDAVQTFMMNLIYGGSISCFSPVTYLSRKEIEVIRPLIFCEEKEIKKEVEKLKLPVVESRCPENGISKRQDTNELLTLLQKTAPDIKEKIMGAMQRADISGWGIKE